MARISNPQRWRCISLHVGSNTPGDLANVESNDIGLWGIAESVDAGEVNCASNLLEHITQQVSSGEDLTAAFLNAHGRHQRETPDSSGASVVAIRHVRSAGTLELAWVGTMHALLLRGKQAISLMSEKHSSTAASGYLVPTERMQQLGGASKHRPRIDRNLVHAQKGDFLLLASHSVDLTGQPETLAANLTGFGNLQYKARKLQNLLAEQSGSNGQIVLCQVG
ncbi:MAG: hypothetical protein ACSHXK_13125 [Oceanococcus sp.]